MISKGVATALSLVAVFGAAEAKSETFSIASLNLTDLRAFDFPLSAIGSAGRIYINTAMTEGASKTRGRKFPTNTVTGNSANLKHLIGWAEAGKAGYDAIQHGALIRPANRPTQMTIGEIYQWIAATPGQPHAIGRYQFIPSTLKNLVHELGLGRNTVFTSDVQDQLADILLEDAGFIAFQNGRIGRHQFMENLARIWAGFPTSTGRSYYHGHAGNRAVITWNEFDTHMKKIFSRRK